jgi:hypothetical protein
MQTATQIEAQIHFAFVSFTEPHSFAAVILHIHSVELGSDLMTHIQSLFGIAVISALALVSQAQSAQAFNIDLLDSHSFNSAAPTKSVPEPGIMLGLAAIGGSVWAKRKRG